VDYYGSMLPALSLIPLRDVALLPGTTTELLVGRTGTLEALKRTGSGLLVFAQQRYATVATPRSLHDLSPQACTGRVLQHWITNSGQQKILAEGVARVSISALLPQLVLLTAQVVHAPAMLDPDAAEAAMATYATWSETLGLPSKCCEPTDAVYSMANALGDRLSTTSLLACADLSEILVEVLDRLDARSGVAWVH
jgi:ATP-dependent Lon protease